jgi:hypothetical protein
VELSKKVAIGLGQALDSLEGSADPTSLVLAALAEAAGASRALAEIASARYGLGDPEALVRWLRSLDREGLAVLVCTLIETRSLDEVRRGVGVLPCQ